MTLYLLDTNILSEMVRNGRQSQALHRLTRVGEANVRTSIIVAAELRYGTAKLGSADMTHRVEAVLQSVPVLALEPAAALHYGTVRAELEAAGQPIGPNDLFIAAHALTIGATLVTANEREFRRVRDLTVENWLAP